MTRRILSVFGFCILGAVAWAEPGPRAVADLVGVAHREFTDPDRSNWAGTGARPVRVTLWYPSAGGGAAEQIGNEGESVTVQREGRIAASPERYPLIMLSHGSGSNAAQVFWLGHFLAQHGFLVVALDHNGTDEEELGRKAPTLTDFFGWERAKDVSVALTRLLADPEFSPRIDPARIGAAGFSLGATTALWTAGARLDLETLRRHSPPPPPMIAPAIEGLIAFSQTDHVAQASVARANNSYRDPRIQSVFALAPPMGAGFTPEGLRDVNVPVLIVVGDADLIAPADGNARHFAAHLPHARLVVVPGERGHYLRPIAAEQRRAELREVAELARTFFEEQRPRSR
ncbi:alpha/beta hydrolase family protein [Opitutus terrae]|uniref:Putative lipoprotein signal peptide n=1 Tax=Opitutus terrae (strain DSM 11246 / JCM 15787 / PB90-1) TaxID=452637 RepID=B1ZQE1_OPITP|nr:lipoprotein signal peptide [Opitutus terrae]ACB73621.1 putative lipoprotein signal peptide [Opitutus terrae PB90-1]